VASVVGGVVTGVREGTATITATTGGKSATAAVTVNAQDTELRVYAEVKGLISEFFIQEPSGERLTVDQHQRNWWSTRTHRLPGELLRGSLGSFTA
jgi:uncharacterized protein YjdB